MAQRISEGKFNLDLYKATIVKALNLESDLNTNLKEVSVYRVEKLVQFYLDAARISSIKMLGSKYTDKALSAAYDSAASLAEKVAASEDFEVIYKRFLYFLKIKALERRDAFPKLAEKYFDICLELGECYKSSSAPHNAAAAFREAALFFNEANFATWSAAKVDPRVEAYNILFESGNYLSAADFAIEAGMDASKVLAAATEAHNIKFNSEYINHLEKGLDITKEYNLGHDKTEAIGKKLFKVLEGVALEKEESPTSFSVAGYYHSQAAFYAKKAGLEDLAKEAAINACKMKFKAAENAKEDFDLQRSCYLFIIDVSYTYNLDKKTTFFAQEGLRKLRAEMEAQKIEKENQNKAAVDLLFSTWFETKRD